MQRREFLKMMTATAGDGAVHVWDIASLAGILRAFAI